MCPLAAWIAAMCPLPRRPPITPTRNSSLLLIVLAFQVPPRLSQLPEDTRPAILVVALCVLRDKAETKVGQRLPRDESRRSREERRPSAKNCLITFAITTCGRRLPECNAELFEFAAVDRRVVVAGFDDGAIT